MDVVEKYNIKNSNIIFNMNKKTRVQKMITFPKEMYDSLESRANTFGLNTPEYIRFLVLSDIKAPSFDNKKIANAIGEAREEYSLGNTKSIESKKDLKDEFSDLMEYAE